MRAYFFGAGSSSGTFEGWAEQPPIATKFGEALKKKHSPGNKNILASRAAEPACWAGLGEFARACVQSVGSETKCRGFRAFPDHIGFSSTVSICNEPMHVHVRRDRQHAKFWLAPVALAWNHGFNLRELNEIRRLLVQHQPTIIEAWHEHCGQR